MEYQSFGATFYINFKSKTELNDFVDCFKNYKKEDFFHSKREVEAQIILKDKIKEEQELLKNFQSMAYKNADVLIHQMGKIEQKAQENIQNIDKIIERKYQEEAEIMRSFNISDQDDLEEEDCSHLRMCFTYDVPVNVVWERDEDWEFPTTYAYVDYMWDEDHFETEVFKNFVSFFGFPDCEIEVEEYEYDDKEIIIKNADYDDYDRD